MKINPPFVRSPHNYDVNQVSTETGLICHDLSLTVQADVEDADINTIVRRFGVTGGMPSNVRMPMSGDFTGIGDYHSALNVVIAADDAFMAMPWEVRRRFEGDPSKLIQFLEDPANRTEAESLGLVVPSPAAAAPDAPSASPVPPAGA